MPSDQDKAASAPALPTSAPTRPPPWALQSTKSAQAAWDYLIQRDSPVETVAEAFAVIGLPIASPLQPLMPSGGEELVLSNLCLVSAAEVKPEGFEVLTETPDGQRAILSAGGSTSVYLAQCLRPQRQCTRPITAIRLVDAGESPPAGFEPADRTAEAERTNLGRTLYVSRALADPRDGGPSAAPLASVAVLARSGRGSHTPPGFERLDGALGAPKAERVLALSRAPPAGLLQTALKATIIDRILRHDRPRGHAADEHEDGSESAYGGGPDEDSFARAPGAARARRVSRESAQPGGAKPLRELPSALPHFCLPQGARLRAACPWPTQHDFALTDADGARLYGCCITVWEPLADVDVMLLRAYSIDERLRIERHLSKGKARTPPPRVAWDGVREEWAAEHAAPVAADGADDALRTAFGSDRRVVLVPRSTRGHAADEMGEQATVDAAAHVAEAARSAEAAEVAVAAAEGGDAAGGSDAPAGAQPGESASAAAHRVSRRRMLSQLAVDGRELYAPTCLCVISRHPFLCSLRTWLCELYRHSLSRSDVPLEMLIGALLWECPLPRPTVSVSLTLGRDEIVFARPAPASALPVHEVRLSSLLHALHPADMLTVFAAACAEQKIILVSPYASQLTSAAEALLALLWPVDWLNVYIPVLPVALLDVLGSPVPYLLGVSDVSYDAAVALGLVRSRRRLYQCANHARTTREHHALSKKPIGSIILIRV